MKYISLDLELEQPKSNVQTPDSKLDKATIIQVGFVIFEVVPEFRILEEYCKCVNIRVPLSKFIKKLTHITDLDISNGVTLGEIYEDLCSISEKWGTSRAIRQWGGGDMECLEKELELTFSQNNKLKWIFGRSGFNVKHLYQVYAQANNIPWRGGLGKSIKNCKLKWQGGRAHNALADALNTAYFFNFLYKSFREGKE